MIQSTESTCELPDPLAAVPERVRIVEVGPRDGLQNVSAVLSTENKACYIALLAESGLKDIEVTSFVNPKRVPQLADAEELFTGLRSISGPRLWALVPNRRGLDRALDSKVANIALFTAASETFTSRNIGMSIGESLQEFQAMIPVAREQGLRVRAYVSTAWVCPFEGEIRTGQVSAVVGPLVEMGVDEVSIGDTIGHASPRQVADLIRALSGVLPLNRTACHFHDTRGTALANVLAALELGVSTFDSASGGVGGCPFAPGAAGNLATEDLLYMLHGMGIETGVNLDRVVEASNFLAAKLGFALPGKFLQSANRGASH